LLSARISCTRSRLFLIFFRASVFFHDVLSPSRSLFSATNGIDRDMPYVFFRFPKVTIFPYVPADTQTNEKHPCVSIDVDPRLTINSDLSPRLIEQIVMPESPLQTAFTDLIVHIESDRMASLGFSKDKYRSPVYHPCVVLRRTSGSHPLPSRFPCLRESGRPYVDRLLPPLFLAALPMYVHFLRGSPLR